LVSYETKPWDGATGGSGYTDWNPPSSEWIPGIYSVQIFVGERFIVSGRFLVQGAAPTAASALSLTPTPTTTFAVLATATPGPNRTSTPTGNRCPMRELPSSSSIRITWRTATVAGASISMATRSRATGW